jgi:hypothetical protein
VIWPTGDEIQPIKGLSQKVTKKVTKKVNKKGINLLVMIVQQATISRHK